MKIFFLLFVPLGIIYNNNLQKIIPKSGELLILREKRLYFEIRLAQQGGKPTELRILP